MTHTSRTIEAVDRIVQTVNARGSHSPPAALLFAEGPGPILVLHIDRDPIMTVYDSSLHGHEKPVTLEFIKANSFAPVRICASGADWLAALEQHFGETLSAQERWRAVQLLDDDLE